MACLWCYVATSFVLLFCTVLHGRHSISAYTTGQGSNGSRAINELLDEHNYDTRIRPDFEGPRVNISVSLFVSSIGSLDEKEMDFTLTFFLRQVWLDRRLAFGKLYKKKSTMSLTGQIIDQVWLPDTYIANERSSIIPKHQFLLDIEKDGTVLYSQRMTVEATCHMDLRYFPMDTQTCSISLGSYGSSLRDLDYHWEGGDRSAVSIADSLSMSQFTLEGYEIRRDIIKYSVGSFVELKLSVTLRREKFYYVVQTYIPTVLIVVLSWVSFWIPRNSPPARVALGITTVLALTTLIFGIQSSMPKVSYVKAIDWFLMVSFMFVFGALIEYPSSTYLRWHAKKLTRRGTRLMKKVKKKRYSNLPEYGSTEQRNGVSGEQNGIKLNKLGSHEDEPHLEKEPTHEPSPSDTEETDDDDFVNVDDPANSKLNTVDKWSRLCFPLAYLMFNLCYWVLFLFPTS